MKTIAGNAGSEIDAMVFYGRGQQVASLGAIFRELRGDETAWWSGVTLRRGVLHLDGRRWGKVETLRLRLELERRGYKLPRGKGDADALCLDAVTLHALHREDGIPSTAGAPATRRRAA